MNARRYVICGVASVALHSLAFAAQSPLQPKFAIKDTQIGNRVAIQLIAAARINPEPELTQKTPAKPLEINKQTTLASLQKPPIVEKTLLAKQAKLTVPLVKKVKPVTTKPVATKVKQKIKAEPKNAKNQASPKKSDSDAQMDQAKDNAPVLIKRPQFKVRPSQPRYPRIAKRRGMEGNVLIEIWLDEDGNQIKQSVLKSSGFDLLDTAALTAVKKWHFNGYQNDGVALAHRVRIPVHFNLD